MSGVTAIQRGQLFGSPLAAKCIAAEGGLRRAFRKQQSMIFDTTI
jgi:hypothetical protein